MWPESGVMSIMRARASVVAAIGIGLVAGPAEAAEIAVNNPDQDGRVFVDIVGNIEAGDDKTFREKVGVLADPEKVVVTLTSDGGEFVTAFLVGERLGERLLSCRPRRSPPGLRDVSYRARLLIESEVRPAEVRANVGVLDTPLIPGVHALFEHRDVLVVRHGSTLSATTLFWGGLTTRSIRLARLRAHARRRARPRWRRSPRAGGGSNSSLRGQPSSWREQFITGNGVG
jgi:hypothetical protein